MAVRMYSELIVWQKAMDLVELVYRTTQRFPREELYGLTSQLRRAAISIPSNIAEGQGRRTARDFLRFLSTARGSLLEVETQILISERLGYLPAAERQGMFSRTDEISRLLSGLCRSLRGRESGDNNERK